jgi:YD repeat-containing protein
VSNPHFATTNPSDGITTFTYDALGRKKLQTNPDSSVESWSYSGNAVAFTNAIGNSWTDTFDALGRLTSVLEPGSLATSYSYDALSNLLSVAQNGVGGTDIPRTRSFTYDSLSRLLTAANPEAGTIGYTYDLNGNVLSRTDARGLTTTYSYDVLNRLLSKVYSDGATPSSCYQYDSSANGIGRLTNEWTQRASIDPCAGTLPSTNILTSRSILGYDPVGRITGEQRCVPNNCAPTFGPAVSYGYDLAGNPTGLTNSVGGVDGTGQPMSLGLTTGYDSGGHMSSVTSNWASYPASIYTLNNYGPVGPLNWSLGPVSPSPTLTVTQGYTNRLWVSSISATGQVP